MSILFGIRQAEGHSVEEPFLRRMASTTDRYAPDGTFLKVKGRIGMGFQPYHTHQRSWLESQPGTDLQGAMVTFDGRLDNSAELCSLLDLKLEHTPDSMIVLESFSRWGETCFSRFVGDWALALWILAERALYLARDHAGTRTLYYELTKADIVWATHLEPLLAERNDHGLDENFAAAYLSSQPIRDLTPYKNVRAVSPAHYLVVRERIVTQKLHWDPTVGERIRYGTDAAYDEHFFQLFQQAVERRTGPGASILAELSGGVDSSSIVCMSDHVRKAQGATPADLINTISYYDDSEPNWNEKPYFVAVERARGKRGLHIEVSSRGATFEPPDMEYVWPGPDGRTLSAETKLEDQLAVGQYRVMLSGIGGDELLGGPPDPLPELADSLVSLQLSTLLSQGLEWGLSNRVPLVHLIRDAGALAVRLYIRQSRTPVAFPSWLSASLRKRAVRLRFQGTSWKRIGYLPSSIENGLVWWSIMETLILPSRRLLARREYRYPFLDRELADFLLRVPANQLMRPGRRRLLMRRALQKIVPVEVLERKRKAYIMRGPPVALTENKPKLLSLVSSSRLSDLGYVDEIDIQSSIAKFDALSCSTSQHLLLAIQLELWMRRPAKTLGQADFNS
ncbi:Asparagine synthetase [glutamine-hydrolyzing] [Acidisarcina polymorpha]|uniref:asparagine synthase (glutamine-hydrolyzing) n=1 Tax=Acidisarcina polymorpha TaxID=2211140 RepID=A0A2Z5G8U9_9BACT|nr:asparagine synthase-related protein [Acidisarcina polymorpha]AXC15551.1 Asparagine synthetase [glutamine-hydrolyzing] [Acidisarcina polymorpha]